jgi:ElaB/YqjD/DUF883 family membrane-anchored ribosome-binding protein
MFTNGMPWDLISIVIIVGFVIGLLKSKSEKNVR